MSKKINKAGLAMAVAAASMFTVASSTLPTVAQEANVKCMGVNACKGQNACKTAANACKGQGGCKGQGFLMMSAKECAAQGGKVEEMKPMKM